MKKLDDYTFGNSHAAIVLARILSNEDNKVGYYVGSTLNEYNTFLKRIAFIKETDLILAKHFAKLHLQEKLTNVNKSKKLSQEVKNFTSNVLNTKYRAFCGFTKN